MEQASSPHPALTTGERERGHRKEVEVVTLYLRVTNVGQPV